MDARVVIVAPRGFGRVLGQVRTTVSGFVADVDHILHRLEIEAYATFGYSMSGVLAARLAIGNPRVAAVAFGGFPLTADLSGMGLRARRRNTDDRRDPLVWAELIATYDPDAGVAFWDDIAAAPHCGSCRRSLPGAGLVGRTGCNFVLAARRRGTKPRSGMPWHSVRRGSWLDHDCMLNQLDVVLPRIASWLTETFRRASTPSET